MCWVQYHTDKTSLFNASSAVYYPINLKYQSGCGGGHIQVSVCEAGASCELLSSLNITTNQTEALPVFVDHTAVLVSAGAEMFDTQHPVESPFPHLQLPTVLPPNFNQSLHSIAVYLDPFLLNSGLSVLNAQGVFNFTLTNDDIPPAVQPYFQLNTTFFRYIFPNLYNKWVHRSSHLGIMYQEIATLLRFLEKFTHHNILSLIYTQCLISYQLFIYLTRMNKSFDTTPRHTQDIQLLYHALFLRKYNLCFAYPQNFRAL